MTVFGSTDRRDMLPHLEHTDESCQVDVTLDNLDVYYNNSRFGLQLVVVTDINSKKDIINTNITTTRSIDDEHTPGVFSVSIY